MKGIVIIYGIEYKYKTCYREGENMWTNGNRYLELKYKKKGKWSYKKVYLATTDFLFSVSEDEYENQNKNMDRFLSMSETEIRSEIITAICCNEAELDKEKKEENKKEILSKAFKNRFN